MKKKLDIESWKRKEHFNFFKNFDEPFWGVTVEVDCTVAYHNCKKNNWSFFLYYLHKSLVAANQIEPFRYHMLDGQVYIYDKVNASPTISRDNGTFGFGYMSYERDFAEFVNVAELEIKRIRSTPDIFPPALVENVIHFSSLPWLNFTSVSHARHFSYPDSCPKISFGKMTERDGRKYMPVSIHVHHALVDGCHVGLFVEEYQKLMNE